MKQPAPIFERHIQAEFENGGRIQFIVRGDNLPEVVRILGKAIQDVPLYWDNTIDLTLSYWHLDEDLNTVEFSSLEQIADPSQGSFQFAELVEKVSGRFMQQLNAHQIYLTTKGDLA